MVLEDLLVCTPVSQLQDKYKSTADTVEEMLGTGVKHSPRITEKKKKTHNSTWNQRRAGSLYPLQEQNGNGIS